MRDQRISLQDIATLAGVTKMTVSRYLRTPHQVAKTTAARIASVMKEIHYSIDPHTPLQRHYTFGVLIPSFQNLLFAELLAGIESVTCAANDQVLIANYNYFQESEEKQIIHLLSCHVDGIILCEKQHSIRTIKYLRAAHIPIVEVMDIQGDALDMQVGFNNRQAACDMVNAMLEKRPRRHIVYMGSKNDSRDKQRLAGYCDALQAVGLSTLHLNPQSISSLDLGKQLMQQALQQHATIDGVLCSNDDLATGALLYCLQQGLSVPEQIAIAGFHGLDIGQHSPDIEQQSTRRLATVITPRFAIGRLAAHLLRQKADNITPTATQIDVGYQLDLGDTV